MFFSNSLLQVFKIIGTEIITSMDVFICPHIHHPKFYCCTLFLHNNCQNKLLEIETDIKF